MDKHHKFRSSSSLMLQDNTNISFELILASTCGALDALCFVG
jgi:hypothetical protein